MMAAILLLKTRAFQQFPFFGKYPRKCLTAKGISVKCAFSDFGGD